MSGNPPFRSYNNLKGVEKTESMEKYEKKKIEEMSGNPPLRSYNNLKGWKKLKI